MLPPGIFKGGGGGFNFIGGEEGEGEGGRGGGGLVQTPEPFGVTQLSSQGEGLDSTFVDLKGGGCPPLDFLKGCSTPLALSRDDILISWGGGCTVPRYF